MKNTIKRALLLIPVISVLLVALAVPVFAQATNGGYIDPVTFPNCRFDISAADIHFVDVTLGVPFSLEESGPYLYPYLLEVDVSSLPGVSFDVSSNNYFVLELEVDGNITTCCASKMTSDGTKLSYTVTTLISGGGKPYVLSANYSSLQSFRILCTDDLFSQLTNIDYTYYSVGSYLSEPVYSVFTDIMTWITSALTLVMGAFYVDGSLTLLGTFAVIGVSVGIGFLLIGIIQRFLKLRG